MNGNGTQPVVVRLADVQPERVSWLWPGRIPAGKLTLLVGDPEAGKSTIALDVAARITTGRAFPDGAACPLGDVVYLTLEDGLADTIRPRLDAAGANPYRVHSITGMVSEEHGESGLVLPTDLPALQAVCLEREPVRLLVLDPLKGYLAAGGDEWKDGSVRRALGPLAGFAERSGVAVLAIVHLTKAASTPAQYRVSGSVAFTAAARSVLLAAADPQNPDNGKRILAPLKCSLCRPPATLAYSLAAPDGTPDGPAAVVWEGESPITARQALAAQIEVGSEERSALDEAVAFLEAELAEGDRPAKVMLRAAAQAGIADRTLKRARQARGVKAVRVGFAPGAEWLWTLNGGRRGPTPPVECHTLGVAPYGDFGPLREPGTTERADPVTPPPGSGDAWEPPEATP